MLLSDRPLRLGTRGSPLALAQARLVARALIDTHGLTEDAVEIVAVQTSGDRIQDRALADIGGKALWTKELDRALHTGEIDFAVHSMKDVETWRPDDFAVAAMLPRADVRDKLVGATGFDALPDHPLIGTSSPRRSAQVRRLRPDAAIAVFRGNVATRLAKLQAGDVHATLLAAAGLDRLGAGEIGTAIPVDVMLPAPSQGAVGVETLAANTPMMEALAAISHVETADAVLAERAVLRGLGGTCHSPIAALAMLDGDGLFLRAEIISPDGQETVHEDCRIARGDLAKAEAIGARLLSRASPGLRSLFEA